VLLLANGDSFTYGYELPNKYDAWPYVLGKTLNFDVINYGICSGSNDYIRRTTLEYLLSNNPKPEEIFVIIGWSSEIRWEGFLDDLNMYAQVKLGREMRVVNEKECRIIRDEELLTVMPRVKLNAYNNISENYLSTYKKSPIYNMAEKYHIMYMMHCVLNSLNIKHIFFNSLTEYSKINHKLFIPNSKILAHQKEMLKNINKIKCLIKEDNSFITETMEDFCKSYPKGKKEGHPLEEGHKAWSNNLLTFINKYSFLPHYTGQQCTFHL
jgi:hypothetical protein